MTIIEELLCNNKKANVTLKCDEQKKDTSEDIDALLTCNYGVVDIKKDGECWFHYVNFETKQEDLDFVRIYIGFYDELSYDDVKEFFNAYEIIFQRIVNGLIAGMSKYTKQAIDILEMLAVYPKDISILEIAIEKLIEGQLGRVENTNYHVVENKGARQLVYVSMCLDDTRINNVVEFDADSRLLTTDKLYASQIGKYYKFQNFDGKKYYFKIRS